MRLCEILVLGFSAVKVLEQRACWCTGGRHNTFLSLQLIGERLFGPAPSLDFMVFSANPDESDLEYALQKKPFTYLTECFVRNKTLERKVSK